MQFSNRLVGTITIPGAPNLAPAEGAAPLICPFGCKNGDIIGEDAVALMIAGALAIPLSKVERQ